jgi:hypothetical protein
MQVKGLECTIFSTYQQLEWSTQSIGSSQAP